MRLGFKIIIPILFLLIIVMSTFGYILYNLNQQEKVISSEGAKIRTLNSLNQRLLREQEQTDFNVLAYRFHQDRAFLQGITQAELDKSKTLDEMYPFITTSKGRDLVNSYITARNEVESLRNNLLEAIDSRNDQQINLQYNKWNIQTQNIKAALSDIGAFNINSLEKTLDAVGKIKDNISKIIIILALVLVMIIIFIFFYLRYVITAPIARLAMQVNDIEGKNFSTTSFETESKRKDELGMLSRAFSTMVNKLKDSYLTLEKKVKERTGELDESNKLLETKLNELERLNKLMVGRELKMIELKNEVEKLKDLKAKKT